MDDTEQAAGPERAIGLLWGAQRGSRGPKPGMTVEGIAKAAIELADADGLAALSMRKVADRLGVGAMSLYRYVPGKTELIEVMVDAVLGEVPPLRTLDNTGKAWRRTLEVYASETWTLIHRHPWMLEVPFGRGLIGPHQAAVIEQVLAALADAGLSDGECVTIFTTVSSFVRGSAWGALEGRRLASTTGMTDEQWWSALGPLMKEHVTPDRFPVQARAWTAEDLLDGRETFEFGLRRLLDGLADHVEEAKVFLM